MNIKTTLYLNIISMEMILSAAEETGKSRSELVVMLMKRLMKDHGSLVRAHRSVRYQVTRPKSCWNRLHLTVCSRDYEQCIDMRKFFKMSVSFLAAYAVERYLAELVDLLLNGERCDNYRCDCYFMLQKHDECSVSWKVIWGLPENPDDLTA